MRIAGRAPRLVFHLRPRPTRQHGKRQQQQQGNHQPMLPHYIERIIQLKKMMEEESNRQNRSALKLQLPLCGNLAKRKKTLRANRATASTTTTATATATTMEIYLPPLMVKIKNQRRPVRPEVLQNNSEGGNRSNFNNSRPPAKLRRFKFPVNSN